MHIDSSVPASPIDPNDKRPWYSVMTRYHWFVLIVAALGWLFDCLDQQLFILARPAAMEALVSEEYLTEARASQGQTLAQVRSEYGNYATSIFMLGWAAGGLVFGVLGDRWGRAKTMIITILMYSLFTGLSAFSVGFWDFAFYRFLTGLGVGGEFAVGVSLVAEVMPAKARSHALGLLQALSAIGNMSAAFINLGLGLAEEQGLPASPWRIMFLIGAIPALLALVIRRNLKEPESWQKTKSETKNEKLGSYSELFGNALWRKHALLGLVLACTGIIGLWSIGFFTPDLIRHVQRPMVLNEVFSEALTQANEKSDAERATHLKSLIAAIGDKEAYAGLSPETLAVEQSLSPVISSRSSRSQSYVSLAQNIGAFLGMFGFGVLSQKIGRKPTFAIALVAALLATVNVFLFLEHTWQIWIMVPIMGFCQLSLFAGYAIYFPELFPTRLRSTGISFCYNVGRVVAAFGPIVKTQLERFFQSVNPESTTDSLRYAGATMSLIFLLGLCVLPFLPETKGKPLPE